MIGLKGKIIISFVVFYASLQGNILDYEGINESQYLNAFDDEVTILLQREEIRQQNHINLIASENYVSKAILEITGSVFTNKYAEGYPNKRYYSGCENVDKIEQLAIDRCKQLFQADHANVQPHSGSQANMAVYMAILQTGDTILSMGLKEGGHISHGYMASFSGKYYHAVFYGVDPKTEQIDYDSIARLAFICKPRLIIAGASAYSRKIDYEKFASIAKSVGAYLLVDMAHVSGLVAAGLHSNPVDYADFVTSTTHKTLRGPRGGFILCKKQFASMIDKAVMPGIQGGPLVNVIAAKAVCFKEAMSQEFIHYQKQIIANTQAMVQAFTTLGYRIVSQGSDNHLLVIDLQNHDITGKEAEELLAKAGIYVNRNCIPFDPQKPWITSGIRIGTAAITTRGMKEKQSEEIVGMIHTVVCNRENKEIIANVRNKVTELSNLFKDNN